MPSTTVLRRRIKSIKNTKQITKAMEKISAVKMRHAQHAARVSRRFAALAWEIASNLRGHVGQPTPVLLKERPLHTVGYVVVSSDRGLCGSLNTKLAHAALASAASSGMEPKRTFLYTMGRKGRETLVRAGFSLQADFGSVPAKPSAASTRPLAETITNDFISGAVDRVSVVYSNCKDTLSQEPIVRQLLPVSVEMLKAEAETMRTRGGAALYTFEPSPEEVLDALLKRIIETQLYQAMLEHVASEHSARMVAMKNATDNITDLIADLTLVMNQNRQAFITREVAEISAGKAALEG